MQTGHVQTLGTISTHPVLQKTEGCTKLKPLYTGRGFDVNMLKPEAEACLHQKRDQCTRLKLYPEVFCNKDGTYVHALLRIVPQKI